MKKKSEKSLFESTPEEILASRPRNGFFSPNCKILSDEELETCGVHIEVIDDSHSKQDYIADELRKRGYSGYYHKKYDGVITHIIPLDKHGRREDI